MKNPVAPAPYNKKQIVKPPSPGGIFILSIIYIHKNL